MVEHPEAFDHVGLLVNEPPGQAGLLFISSSDDSHSSFHRSRLPLPTGSLIPLIVSRGSEIASEMFLVSLYYESEMARGRASPARSPSGTLAELSVNWVLTR